METSQVQVEQYFHLLQLLSPGSLPLHKLQLEEHYLSDDQTCRIWVESHASDTSLHTTLPASARSKQEFGVSLPILPGRWEGAKSSAAQIQHLPTSIFFLRERRTRGRSFAENVFCLLWLQLYSCQGSVCFIFPEMTHEQEVRLRQVAVPSEISQHWNAKSSIRIWITCNSGKDLRCLASLK